MKPIYPNDSFTEITTEEDARRLIWHARFNGQDFICPPCENEQFNTIKTRTEVRTCKSCRKQTRLRAATLFESSKTPLLIWALLILRMLMRIIKWYRMTHKHVKDGCLGLINLSQMPKLDQWYSPWYRG